jgi:hypothetical protein
VDASLRKGDLKFTLDGFKLKGSWVLVRTSGRFAGSSGPPDRSWLIIKHRDDWAGPIDITTFAPLSVKTPDADLADILAADNPDVWRSNAPAKTGDTGTMFRRIIERALEIRDENTKGAKGTKGTKGTKEDTGALTKASKVAKASKASKAPARKRPPASRG